MNAGILSVGDELILGQIAERNAGWLSGRLADEGVLAGEHRTVPDDLDAMVEALAAFASRFDVVISTGGLGPTDDDLTRAALARVLGGGALVVDDAQCARISRWFAGRGRTMPAINLRQAERPPGAVALDNDAGTAPGLSATLRRCRIWCLPGPPAEMRPMFERFVVPALFGERARPTLRREAVPIFGLGESTIAERLAELMERGRNPLVGTTASESIVTVRVRAHGAAAEDRAGFDALIAEILRRTDPYALGVGDVSIGAALGAACLARGATVALAESCTGGLAAARLCEAPGASAWFKGGVVSYSNELKESLLSVSPDTLARHGAVSAETAIEMAQGALSRLGASAAASITGVAGPDGGSAEKRVGTVFIATIVSGEPGPRVRAFRFPGDRNTIRERAAKSAIGALRLHLRNEAETTLLAERTTS